MHCGHDYLAAWTPGIKDMIADRIHSFAADHDHYLVIQRDSLLTVKTHERVVVTNQNQGLRRSAVLQGLSELLHDLEVSLNSFLEGHGDAPNRLRNGNARSGGCFWWRCGDGNRGGCGGCGAVLAHAGRGQQELRGNAISDLTALCLQLLRPTAGNPKVDETSTTPIYQASTLRSRTHMACILIIGC